MITRHINKKELFYCQYHTSLRVSFEKATWASNFHCTRVFRQTKIIRTKCHWFNDCIIHLRRACAGREYFQGPCVAVTREHRSPKRILASADNERQSRRTWRGSSIRSSTIPPRCPVRCKIEGTLYVILLDDDSRLRSIRGSRS